MDVGPQGVGSTCHVHCHERLLYFKSKKGYSVVHSRVVTLIQPSFSKKEFFFESFQASARIKLHFFLLLIVCAREAHLASMVLSEVGQRPVDDLSATCQYQGGCV